MAIDKSPPSRSYFTQAVSLQDWWLTKPQTNDGRKGIGVSGLTGTSQLSRAERCFSSAPILKAYDTFEVETVDGTCVILQGYINKEKTLQSGFSSEVFDHFIIGFPYNWDEFSTSSPKRGSSEECISRDEKDSIGNFADTSTMDTEVEDCKDKVVSNISSTISLDDGRPKKKRTRTAEESLRKKAGGSKKDKGKGNSGL